MITSKHAMAIVLAGLIGTVITQQGCSSDTSGPTGGTAGGGGAATGTAGAPAAGAPAAGAPAAGAPSAGASATGGGGAGGAAAGSGGTGGGSAGSAGTGGGSAGSAGSAGMGGSGGGGSSATFMAVKSLFAMSCGTGQCHNAASKNLDYQGTNDLHGLLTKPIATGIAHCVGTTLVTPNDTNSFLVTIVKMSASCPTGGGTAIGKMPDNCGQAGKPACLTDTQIKVITDWIAAGAPN